jgi:hypothetical protein
MSDATFDSLLIHTCTIKRRSTNSSSINEWGAADESITLLASNVPCLIQQREEIIEFERRGQKLFSRHLAFFKINAGIREDDIVEFGGKSFRVFANADAAGQSHHLEVGLYTLDN